MKNKGSTNFLKIEPEENHHISSERTNINKGPRNKSNSLLMFERLLLNNKNKFYLDNHFDKHNSQKFLLDKEKYLSEIIFDDEGEVPSKEAFEKNKSKIDLIIPDGAPTKFTFGQN